jgi:hypothetical protein
MGTKDDQSHQGKACEGKSHPCDEPCAPSGHLEAGHFGSDKIDEQNQTDHRTAGHDETAAKAVLLRMGPNRLGFEDIERDVSDPAIEIVFFDIDNGFFVLCQRPDKEDEHSEEEHRASDF